VKKRCAPVSRAGAKNKEDINMKKCCAKVKSVLKVIAGVGGVAALAAGGLFVYKKFLKK
jgi:hypothetical protein